jgi:hypothetical protein
MSCPAETTLHASIPSLSIHVQPAGPPFTGREGASFGPTTELANPLPAVTIQRESVPDQNAVVRGSTAQSDIVAVDSLALGFIPSRQAPIPHYAVPVVQ